MFKYNYPKISIIFDVFGFNFKFSHFHIFRFPLILKFRQYVNNAEFASSASLTTSAGDPLVRYHVFNISINWCS